MSVAGLAIGGAALITGFALADPANARIDALRWRRRARALPRRGAMTVAPRRGAMTVAQASAAAPLLRRRAGSDWLARRLPGPAAQLAAAGGAALGTVVAVAVSVAALLALLARWAGMAATPLLALAPVAALVLLHVIAHGLARRTRSRFARCFPDALAILIRALRAGLPVPSAIAEAASGAVGPVARAFNDVIEAMRLGAPVEAALWATARRLGSAEFDLLVVTIGLQRETGGNLASSLANLDDTLRQRRLLALKIKAMAAEARASSLIIASMPFAMAALMAVVSPDYLMPLLTTPLGRAMIGAGLASLATGGLIIGQLMRIEP